jgi:hypothetical protein
MIPSKVCKRKNIGVKLVTFKPEGNNAAYVSIPVDEMGKE